MKKFKLHSILLALSCLGLSQIHANATSNPPLDQWFPLQGTDSRAQFQGFYTNNYQVYKVRFTNGFPASYVPKVCVYSEDQGVKNATIAYDGTYPTTDGVIGYVEVPAGVTLELFTMTSTNASYLDPRPMNVWVPGDVESDCHFSKK